jgi:acetyl esterase/lipase
VPKAFLIVSILSALASLNAIRPIRFPLVMLPSFVSAWLTVELAQFRLLVQLVATAAFVAAGALRETPGRIGLVVMAASIAGTVYLLVIANRSGEVMERALREALGDDYRSRIDPDLMAGRDPGLRWQQVLKPFRLRHPKVERVRDITFARAGGSDLHLDLFRHRSHPEKCPTLLQIHGGAWVLGHKEHQAIPLMMQLAAHGWVCVNVDYRLSPKATFPDHLLDVKQAMRWVKDEGPAYGIDPEFVVVTGGSAGGHLTALMGLTANEPEYQPGFEDVDTMPQACVPFYGVYDFINRTGTFSEKQMTKYFLARTVMKVPLAKDPEAWRKASPLDLVHEGADLPPFFVIHGANDTLASTNKARAFVERLRVASRAPVVHAELPGAQHAFEIFPSVRSIHVVLAVERFLDYIYSQYLRAHGEEPPLEGSVTAPKGEGS